jgi:hypothetical protein
LITIAGLCDHSAANAGNSGCKTVITRAEFEATLNALQPGMPKHARREFALLYSDALVMAEKAQQLGLDKGTNYKEQMRLARIEVLSQALKKEISAKASDISGKDIEDYYQKNIARFEKAEIERVYVPKDQKPSPAFDGKLTDADSQERSVESEQAMKRKTDDLRTRAVAGEDFITLQADAYQVAGIKNAPPGTTILIRRISLPASQVSVMDLKPGEVSAVLSDPNGYYIYKLRSKDMLSLNQARDEIKGTYPFNFLAV